MDWIDLVQEWVSWRALVSTVMDPLGPYNAGNLLPGEPLASQEGP